MTRDSGRLPEGEDAERSGAAECEASQSGAAKTAHRPNDTPNPKIEAQAREMLKEGFRQDGLTYEALCIGGDPPPYAAALRALEKALSLPSVEIRREALEEALKDLARHSYQHGFLDATHHDGPPTDNEEAATLKRIDSVAVHESFESLRDKFFLDAGVIL